jgi:cell division septation protein DedD
VPFADLVASDVVAPDQVVHGSAVEVRYTVTNRGSATTQGDSAAVNSWTDSVWLTTDARRPNPAKGDVRIGQVTHSGHLAVGADYLGTLQAQIPEGMRSGQYFLTVWSDTYDVILEDTLASNINPDDPSQIDNNNYKARAVSVLGTTPPDLVVNQATAPTTSSATRCKTAATPSKANGPTGFGWPTTPT